MNFEGTIALETKRLILRKITIDDAEDMYNNWASDDVVTKYLLWLTHKNVETSKEIAKLWIENYQSPSFYLWVMELKENHQVIGSISILDINEELKSGEFGYCMSQKYWNQGLMSEGVRSILNYLFTKVKFDTIYARHQKENIASGKVMIKNKMRYLCTKEELIKKTNKVVIMNYYQITKDDFIREYIDLNNEVKI